MEVNFENNKNVYFIGIGGIGVSAIATLMKTMGKKVSGTDISTSPVTESLRKTGIKINKKHEAKNISNEIDLVIHTIAIQDTNPELATAKKLGIKTLTYPQALSIISKNLTTIAVSGTHGKTTTTAMLTDVFLKNKQDPTVIVGSILKGKKSNIIVGKSKYFIVEACEYRRSFLNLSPTVLIITNIKEDHLDYYKDISDIKKAFREIAVKIPRHGAIICDKSDENIKDVVKGLKCKIIDSKNLLDGLKLKIPGKHNRQNATKAFLVGDFFKLNQKVSLSALNKFEGTWRRSEYKGLNKNKAKIYDDYAHHPDEIRATLSGIKELYPNKSIKAYFQPIYLAELNSC
jgi:UDP-N-acetylmuramate--alanine ligase